MKTRRLVLTLSIATIGIWIVCAFMSLKLASLPLLGLLPFGVWTSLSGPSLGLLLIPIGVYAGVAVLAWKKSSQTIAWLVPFAPLLGVALYFAQLGVAKYIVRAVLG